MGATDNRERLLADMQFGAGLIVVTASGFIQNTYAPATWFVGLSTTPPNGDGTGFTEPSGGSYARVAVANDLAHWAAASVANGITSKVNAAKVTFINPTGSWGTIGYYGVFQALTGGLPEYWNALDASISPRAGNSPVEFDVGQLVLTWGAST